MKKTILLLTILFCCFFNAVAREQIEPEEYQVYKAWLEQAIIRFQPETKQIDIVNFTADNVHGGLARLYEVRSPLTKLLQPSTNRNYKLRNRKSYELSNNFDVKPIVNFIDDVNTYRGTSKSYLNFEDKSSIPWVFTFSRVGFNKNKTQALIHVEYGYFGYFWLLSKKNGKWIVLDGRKSWEH